MMAKAHVLTGVAGVAVFAYLGDLTPTAFALAITSIPGFALLPDIDHAKSMVSSTYGWVTRVFAFFFAHRRETHSFPGIATFGLVTWAAAHWHDLLASQIWLTLMLVLGWAALFRAFRLKSVQHLLPLALAIPTVWFRDEWVASGGSPYPLEFIPTALVLGMLLHVAGDCLTNSGCPLWWPFSKKRTAFSFTLFGKKRSMRTNSRFEHRVVLPLLWILSIGPTLLWVSGRL